MTRARIRQNTIVLWGSAALVAACGGDRGEVTTAGMALTEVTLEDVGLNNTFSVLTGVNSAGEMVGVYQVGSGIHAFRLIENTLTDIHPSGSGQSWATALNASGDAGGHVDSAAVVWPANSSNAVDIETLPSSFSYVNQINSASQAVGTRIDPAGHQRAFFWSATTGMIDVGDLGGDHTFAFDINELGQIAGSSTLVPNATERRAMVWQNGVITDLGTLGGVSSGASDVNDNGVVVGYSETSTGQTHACMWIDGGIVDLDPTGTEESYALAINNSGHVVGVRLEGGQARATLWRDGGAIDLGAGAGAQAFVINDLGVVSGIRDGALAFVWANPADGAIDLPAPPGAAQRTTATALGPDMAVGWASQHPNYTYPDGRAALWRFVITPPAPNEAVDVLDDAVADSSLGTSEAAALGHKLDAALHQCELGHENAARSQIQAFMNQVQAFINSGRLSTAEGQNLLALAQAVLDDLSC